MPERLRGKVAVVTGGSKGLGAAIARSFGTESATVVVNYAKNAASAETIVEDIRRLGGRAVSIKADMTDPDQVTDLFRQTSEMFGRVDVLVNNAGLYEFAPIEALNRESFDRHFQLNVFGYLLAVREAIKHMQPGGSIINMSSTVTMFGPENASVYTATKGAIDGLTRALSNELAKRRIRVNAIKPGVVHTEGVEAGGFLDSDFSVSVISRTPLKRLGTPEDIAPAAVYLASDESSWITGEFITISGGHR
ncbi:SDR family NAD(P)-dependent oxidoreductase [Paraburkholderia caribensis]|uniref:SDR family NAD(P)-dependent oxidoreductase n=1 Tax=Paraburkholderia caribensis TaxID=75105 RepID=UPI001590E736|nr:glucose 1-dehydrogenase [Paraburkholderia caribensis]